MTIQERIEELKRQQKEQDAEIARLQAELKKDWRSILRQISLWGR